MVSESEIEPNSPHRQTMATALISPPAIDWTEDDGLYGRVQQFTKGVDDIMLGPLSTNKEPAKTRTLMCWLPENIKELVREAGKDTENNYGKVTDFLLQWARPKTTVYNSFKMLKGLHQGSMNFEQFAAKVRKLVTDCNIQDTQDRDLIIRNFIVTGANSQTAYRQCVEAGPDATLQKVLEIYRNDSAVQAHFQTRHSSQSAVHQINAQCPLGEEEEQDVHKLQNSQKRRYSQSAKASTPEKRSKVNVGRVCRWCGHSHRPRECPAYGKECLHCGIMNHFARVCNKRQSPRTSPSNSPRRSQSPRSGQYRNYRSSNVNRLEADTNQAMVIRNLQEQLNQIQMQQQTQVNTHSLRTTPVFKMPDDSGIDYPPPFFISRNERRTPQASVKMLQTEVIEVCQLSERNSEHIRPAWISRSKDSPIEQIDCEVDTGAGCNVIGYNQAKKLFDQE